MKKDSEIQRKIRLDMADALYSEMDTEKAVSVFKEQQEKSLLIRQYVKKETKSE